VRVNISGMHPNSSGLCLNISGVHGNIICARPSFSRALVSTTRRANLCHSSAFIGPPSR
jgi:hypothetical protein